MSKTAIDTILNRHSCRDFNGKPLKKGDLETLTECARQAPSAGNMQPWHCYVVTDQAAKERLAAAAYGQSFVAAATVVFVVCGDPDKSAARYAKRGSTLYYIQDTAAMVENLLLAATALDYGSCWVGAFDEAMATNALSIPTNLRPLAIIPVGPGKIPTTGTQRKSKEEVFEAV
ncbi:MAG: nitroreductase family protein [Planctomycetota bacterium]|nr:nitroreductase family protein [Planctomycetota bacterium]